MCEVDPLPNLPPSKIVADLGTTVKRKLEGVSLPPVQDDVVGALSEYQ